MEVLLHSYGEPLSSWLSDVMGKHVSFWWLLSTCSSIFHNHCCPSDLNKESIAYALYVCQVVNKSFMCNILSFSLFIEYMGLKKIAFHCSWFVLTTIFKAKDRDRSFEEEIHDVLSQMLFWVHITIWFHFWNPNWCLFLFKMSVRVTFECTIQDNSINWHGCKINNRNKNISLLIKSDIKQIC